MLDYDGKRIQLVCKQVDMRKSINGLSIYVQMQLEQDPMGGMYVFCNRNRNRLKILEWDEDGFWLYCKRLEKGRYSWPSEAEEEPVMELDAGEMRVLTSGTKLVQKFRRSHLSNMTVC